MISKVILVLFLAIVASSSALPHGRAGMPKTKLGDEVAAPKPHQSGPKKLVCYYGSWAVYRPGDGKFDVEDIDPFLCTHLVFGFAALSIETWEIEAFDPWNDLDPEEGGGKGAYRRFNALKNINPELTTILAIGGWNAGSMNYSEMAADPAKRAVFVRSCVDFVKKYGFDGLDMDWEYPTFRGGDEDDKQNFAALLHELRAAFTPAGLLLTSAVSPDKFKADQAYDMQALIDTLDMVNVMAYDYHGAWAQYVHHNAPVYQHPLDIGFGPGGEDEWFNQNETMHYWVQLMKENSHRIMMGMPFYGRGFTLDDPNDNGIHANATYPGRSGPYTRQPGVLGHNEQCEIKRNQSEGFTEHWDNIIKAKYCIFKNDTTGVRDQWFSYEDVESLEEKLRLLHSLPIGGGMIWSLDTDDFRNTCGKGKSPLLRYVSESLHGGVLPTPDPDKTTTRPNVTPPNGQCTHPGLNPTGPCSEHYLVCVQDVDGSWISTPGECADGTVVNPDLGICDYPENVAGCAVYKERRVNTE